MRWALIITFLFSSLSLLAAEKPVHVEEKAKNKPKRFWLNFGAGLPQLASLEFSYRLFPRWYIGASYGIIPGGQSGSLSPTFSLPSQNVVLANKQFVTFDQPTVQSSLTSLSPFFRFFPGTNEFYLQFTMAVWQVRNNFDSALLDINGNTIVDASYKGLITVSQYLPTVSMGHVFNSELFFFNVNMGITIAASTQVAVSSETILPDSMGGTSANQEQIDQINSKANSSIQDAMGTFRDQVKFLPSIHLTFGFMF